MAKTISIFVCPMIKLKIGNIFSECQFFVLEVMHCFISGIICALQISTMNNVLGKLVYTYYLVGSPSNAHVLSHESQRIYAKIKRGVPSRRWLYSLSYIPFINGIPKSYLTCQGLNNNRRRMRTFTEFLIPYI